MNLINYLQLISNWNLSASAGEYEGGDEDDGEEEEFIPREKVLASVIQSTNLTKNEVIKLDTH